MRRSIFEQEHHDYRGVVRDFIAREIAPHYADWESAGRMDRGVFRAGVAAGLYGLEIPEVWGGPGIRDYRYRMVASEELAKARATSVSVSFVNQDDLFLYYLLDLGTQSQLERWMPGFASGDVIGALAMTEPAAGSDLRGMKSVAVPRGDGWVLNGQKTFITHGPSADVIIVAAQTGEIADGSISLFLVPGDAPGLDRGNPLKKMGLRSQDTGELFFSDVHLGPDALLGEVGQGLRQMMSHLPRERLGTTVCAIADARAVFDLTVEYAFDREAFGQPVGDFQANRFYLAEMATELDMAEVYVDNQVEEFNAGRLDAVDAAKAKWWVTELQRRVIDRCVQLHGGYGFMLEYPVAMAYLDARIQTIYGGTTEIMKEIIGRQIAREAKAR